MARGLDPKLNVLTAAEPVARQWVEENLSPLAKLKEAGGGFATLGELLAKSPELLSTVETAARDFAQMMHTGIRLDDATATRLAQAQAKEAGKGVWARFAVGLIAGIALAAIYLNHIGALP